MTPVTMQFEYATGLLRSPLTAATLVGSWDASGQPSPQAWSELPMRRGVDSDGSDAFFADVTLDEGAVDHDFAWGVYVQRNDDKSAWGIAAEVADLQRAAQERTFTLRPSNGKLQRETYCLTHHRARGARPLGDAIRFMVWAPNARAVEVVFGGATGYIADDGTGADPTIAPLAMQPDGDGLWIAVADEFAAYGGRSYMYRVTRDDGQVAYRTDMYSLAQCGAGDVDPDGRPFGDVSELDGSPSCTLVVDTDVVDPYPAQASAAVLADDAFWSDEFDAARPVPRRVEDLVIHELHVGALAPQTESAGTLALLPYLEDLGINAVELLREMCQTLKTIAPDCLPIAEDHSGWQAVTQPAAQGGIGFDAVWNVDFYHHLMSAFAAALARTVDPSVVYVESHDEAGGAEHSARTIAVAVDGAPLVGTTPAVAEARCRFVVGMSLLSAATPMLLMGEEGGAQQKYTYDRFYEDKEDLLALRAGNGGALFAFYADLIALRLGASALRARNLEILHVHDANRVLAFRSWDESGEDVVVGSLNERHYDSPEYRIGHGALGDGRWRERLNSNAIAYGGDGTGNGEADLRAVGGSLGALVPAMGFVVLESV